MLKYLLTTALATGAVLALASGASAADKKYTFALVPKNTNNPFFDQALAGCKKAEKELNGKIECLYIGPGEHGGGLAFQVNAGPNGRGIASSLPEILPGKTAGQRLSGTCLKVLERSDTVTLQRRAVLASICNAGALPG